jgi:K+ transporter
MGAARDWVIIIWGVMSILTLVIVSLIAVMIGLSVKNLVSTVNELVNTSVKPVIESTQNTVTNVTGTAQFLGDTVVTPIIRLFSFVAGLRRGLAVFTGVTSKLKGGGGKRRA